MKKQIVFIISTLLLTLLCGSRPACAQGALPQFHVRADLAPEYSMFIPDQLRFEDIELPNIPENAQGDKAKINNQKKSRVALSVSRLVVGGQSVDPFEDDKISKWNLLKSLPNSWSNAQSYQDSLEIVGKIFEPKVTLDIEF